MDRARLVRQTVKYGTIGGAVFVAILAAWVMLPLPAAVLARPAGSGVTVVDRNGLVLRSTRAADGSDTRWLAYDQIDPDIINAFVAVEDRRFWEHHGVDARAVARAVRDNFRARHVVSGASTITMQLARLLRPASHHWDAKIAQALWALRLNAHLSKQRILEQYLNRVELGQGTAGVAAASALYFDASASDVSIGQAATLAGLAHAPSRDNPHVSPRRASARRLVALRRMMRLRLVTRDEVARARQEPLVRAARSMPFLAPHFTTRVLSWTGADTARLGGATTIHTSLDLALQTELEAEVRHTVDVLHDRGVMHAAVVVVNNRTGEVLAWVGSPDFWAPENGQTDMVVSARQPGSALKPFLYGLAFDRGFTAATILPDIPKTYATATGTYQPRDYDRRFRGPTRAREALASSYNVPAVDLASRVGAANLLETLDLAGFKSLQRDAEYYGLGLALGNGDVTLLELANAYRALANGGEWRPWTWQPIAPGSAPPVADNRRVISPVSAAIVLDILQDPVARMPGFGFFTPFDFPFPVAVKTGTSRHFTDNWAVATAKGFTVAVWAGNFSGRPMEGVSGVTGAGPLLHRAVMATARHVSPSALTSPGELGAIRVPVCRLSGLRATSQCAQLAEWFVPGTEPKRVDDWERGGRVTLPDEYAEWSRQALRVVSEPVALASTSADSRPLPNATRLSAADSLRREHSAIFHIASPLDGDRYSIPPGIEARYATIPLRAAGADADGVTWIVDGKVYDQERWQLQLGEHVVQAKSARGENARVRIFVDR